MDPPPCAMCYKAGCEGVQCTTRCKVDVQRSGHQHRRYGIRHLKELLYSISQLQKSKAMGWFPVYGGERQCHETGMASNCRDGNGVNMSLPTFRTSSGPKICQPEMTSKKNVPISRNAESGPFEIHGQTCPGPALSRKPSLHGLCRSQWQLGQE